MYQAAKYINDMYGEGSAQVVIEQSYRNMREIIEPQMYIVDRAYQAMEEAGITPYTVPIRGGTDGAQLSFMGLPCPNLSTGGDNAHGTFEYCSITSMKKMVQVIKNLITDLAK